MLPTPLRHHRRTPSCGRPPIKETLDASLSYDGESDGFRINQYTLQREIGRGSFGAVHHAVDMEGNEYAIKEFSKSRLRRRSQAHLLRRPRADVLSAHGHRRSASEIFREKLAGNPLYLIREEIAVLKKLDHENIVKLFEVLDDPEGDSLYMVMEMCEKGAVIDVDLDRTAVPYKEDQCRLWFRDMLLGVEYLHSQGIVHRDIKPDNLLVTGDNVLKIADFGVSETFEKSRPMMTSKSAGSPAFVPPELCYVGHGDVSGTAVDVWSMGVTLYCLMFGQLPFSQKSILNLCEAIKHDEPYIPETLNPDLRNLLTKMLEKDPARRITVSEMRVHPWVTRHGEDKLLPYEENTAAFISTPSPEEVATAVTKSIHNVMAVVRAVSKLKRLVLQRRARQSDAQQSTGSGDRAEPDKTHPTVRAGEMSMEMVANALPAVDGDDSPPNRPGRTRSTTWPSIVVTDEEFLRDEAAYGTHGSPHTVGDSTGAVPRSLRGVSVFEEVESPVAMDDDGRHWRVAADGRE